MKIKNLLFTVFTGMGGILTMNAQAPAQLENNTAAAVEITNWKTDLVAEELNSKKFNGITQGWTGRAAFFTTSINAEGALCADDGIVTVKSGNIYLVPVTAKNATPVEKYGDDVELTLAQPVATSMVNILVVAKSENGMTLNTILNYEDGTTSDEMSNAVSHWINAAPTGNEALSGLGVVTYDYYDGAQLSSDRDRCIYEISVVADPFKLLRSISFTVSGGGYNDIAYVFGINAKAAGDNIKKHLEASLENDKVTVRKENSANIVVKYTLTDMEGVSDKLAYNAEASNENVAIGEIANDETYGILTIPVNGVELGRSMVTVNLELGVQKLKFSANVTVKSIVTANTDNCLSVSNWADDVIAESDVYSTTSRGLDEQGWTLYTEDVEPVGALVGDDNLIVATSGNVYHIAPANGNNATVIAGGKELSLQFTEPLNSELINLLVISANGNSQLELVPVYEDETTGEAISASANDWYASSPDGTEAKYGLGRISSNNDVSTDKFFRLFEISAPTSKDRKVKSLNIANKTNGAYLTVLGANAEKKSASGIDNIVSNSEFTIESVSNLQGQKVDAPSAGLYIVRYSNGTSAKVFFK